MATSDGNGVHYQKSFHGDHYAGTKEALVAAGVAPSHLFPGEPGRGKASCTYVDGKPVGKGCAKGSRAGAGYLQIARINSRRYRITRGIAEEERAKRRSVEVAEGEAMQYAWKADAEALLKDVPHDLRRLCESQVNRLGSAVAERLWMDPTWLRNQGVEDVAPQVRAGLELVRLANQVANFGMTDMDAADAARLMEACCRRVEKQVHRPKPRSTHLRLVWSAGSSVSP